jgi:alpha-tubulin suppressor-like RCC1 family protein
MRYAKVMVGFGLALFGGSAWLAACGGDEGTKKDGGLDGTNNGDVIGMMDSPNPMMDTGPGDDTGTGDTGTDTGSMDAGPNCMNNPCVVGLAVGGRHACALIVDGTVRCWGFNGFGQIGAVDGGFSMANRLVPAQVDGLSNVTQIAAPSYYFQIGGTTCARTSNGGVLCMGNNQAAGLGLNSMMGAVDNNPHQTAAQVQGLPMSANVALGRYMGCAATNNNEYWCWGSNDGNGNTTSGVLGRGANPMGYGAAGKASLLDASAASGAPGSWFNLALTPGGTIYSWGDNSAGQLGRGNINTNDINPAPVTGLSNVTQMTAGANHACAISGGKISCWGDNTDGQLGRGIVGGSSNNATVTVTLPGNKSAAMVSCSGSHTCALATDGTVYCWGNNNAGQIGNGMPSNNRVSMPAQVMGIMNAIAVGAGESAMANAGYSCALINGGSVQCWGFNGDGTLGRGADAGTMACQTAGGAQCSPTPAPVVWQ